MNNTDHRINKRGNVFSVSENEGRKQLSQNEILNYLNKKKSKQNFHQNIDFDKIDHNSIKIIAELMNKPNKSNIDANILMIFMKKLNELMTMIRQVNEDNSEELLLKISLSLKHKYMESNRVIFKYGSKGDGFYIILYGSVDILIPKEQKINMSEEEYIRYLLKLKKYDELELLNKTMNANKNIYHVEQFLAGVLGENADHNKFVKKKMTIKKNLEKDIINTLNYLNNLDNNKDEIISSSNYIDILSPDIYDTKNEKNIVSVYKYYSVINLKQGSKFGDVALDSQNQKRTATIITLEETHLGILHKSFYEQCIKSVNEIVRKNHVNFISSTKLFSNINKIDFQKYNFNNFAYEKITRNTKIIKQGDEPLHVYILKSGEYEVYFNKSIFQMNDLIISLGGKISKEEDTFYLNKVKSEKKYIKLAIIKDFDILGLEDCIVNKYYSFTVECISNFGEIYRVHNSFLKNMCDKDAIVHKNMTEFVIMKKKFYLDRVLEIKDNRLKIYDNFYYSNIKKSSSNSPATKLNIKHNNLPTLKSTNQINTHPTIAVNMSMKSIFERKLKLKDSCVTHHNRYNSHASLKINLTSNLKTSYENKKISIKSKILSGTKYNNKIITKSFEDKNKYMKEKTILRRNSVKILESKMYFDNILNKIGSDKHNLKNIYVKKDMNKQVNVVDCLAMDNFERQYNTLYYFSSKFRNNKKSAKDCNLLTTHVTCSDKLSTLEINNSKYLNFESKMCLRDRIKNNDILRSRSKKILIPKIYALNRLKNINK